MPIVFRKTTKGEQELRSRQRVLAPAMRHALILANGQRGEDELRGLLGERGVELLLDLMADDYIEAFSSQAPYFQPHLAKTAATQSA